MISSTAPRTGAAGGVLGGSVFGVQHLISPDQQRDPLDDEDRQVGRVIGQLACFELSLTKRWGSHRLAQASSVPPKLVGRGPIVDGVQVAAPRLAVVNHPQRGLTHAAGAERQGDITCIAALSAYISAMTSQVSVSALSQLLTDPRWMPVPNGSGRLDVRVVFSVESIDPRR